MARRNSSWTKCALFSIVSFLLCLSVFLVFYATHGKDRHTEPHSLLFKSVVRSSKLNDKPKVIILLQQSPVQPDNQLQRLHNIDNTWATWTQPSDSFNFDIRLVAAVLNRSESREVSLSNKKPSQFKNIDTIPMYPDSKTNIFDKSMAYDSYTPSNYHNMLRSLITLFTSNNKHYTGGNGIKWLVYANDHTFMIPDNLDAFLTTLDASQLIYTG